MKKILYPIMLDVSLILLVLAFTILSNTEWLGGVVTAISIYLSLGALIIKANDKLKNTFICTIDLLFFLP